MIFITKRHEDLQIAADVQRDITICWEGNFVSVETPLNYMSFNADRVTLHDMELHFAPSRRTHINDVRCMTCGTIIRNCDDYYAQCDECFDRLRDIE